MRLGDPGVFETASGALVSILDPDASPVTIDDIASALSRQCRFAGHLRPNVDHYSVAQHSLLVARLCKPEHGLVGLLHDAAEAYVQDVIGPLKALLGARYAGLEMAWARRIGIVFELGDALVHLPADVKEADARALETERRDLRVNYTPSPSHDPGPDRIFGLTAPAARRAFIHRFDAYQSARGFG